MMFRETILMKYHALFVLFFEKAEKLEIVVCCKFIGGALRFTIYQYYRQHLSKHSKNVFSKKFPSYMYYIFN